MSLIKFLGVYSGRLPNINENKNSLTGQYWYIWYNSKEMNYLIQPIGKKNTVENTSYIITPTQFKNTFKEENLKLAKQPSLPNFANVRIYKEPVPDEVSPPKINSKKPTSYESPENSDVFVIKGNKEKKVNDKKNDDDLDFLLYDSEEIKETKQSVNYPEPNYPKSGYGRSRYSEPQPPEPLTEPYTKPKEPHFSDFDPLNEDEELLLQPLSPHDEEVILNKKNKEAMILNIRYKDDFNQALSLLHKGRVSLANSMLDDLLKVKSSTVSAHKHTFTDFAIRLRKLKQPQLSLKFALLSTELSPADSHAFFNVARIYYELKQYNEAFDYLQKALSLEPTLAVAKKLMSILTPIIQKSREKVSLL